ncbi:hypothetical protein Lal_00024949, partial [Lupinus albus]
MDSSLSPRGLQARWSTRPIDRSSYLYCLSNPKILIRGGVLRVGSDPIPAVKVLPDPAHLPLKLECLYSCLLAQVVEAFSTPAVANVESERWDS